MKGEIYRCTNINIVPLQEPGVEILDTVDEDKNSIKIERKFQKTSSLQKISESKTFLPVIQPQS